MLSVYALSSESKDSIIIPDIDDKLIESVTNYIVSGDVIKKIENEGALSCFSGLFLVKITEVKKGQIKVNSEILIASVNDVITANDLKGRRIYLVDLDCNFYEYCKKDKLGLIKKGKIKKILKLE